MISALRKLLNTGGKQSGVQSGDTASTVAHPLIHSASPGSAGRTADPGLRVRKPRPVVPNAVSSKSYERTHNMYGLYLASLGG